MFEKLLVIESNAQIRKYMGSFLKRQKYQCMLTDKGEYGWSVIENSFLDLIVLDMMMEDCDSLKLIRDIRKISMVPIIATSIMKDNGTIVIEALDSGADDYVIKPFGEGEFLARVRAKCRRRYPPENEGGPQMFQVKYLMVDFYKMRATVHGERVHFTPIEYKLLSVLVNNRGKMVTNENIEYALWGTSLGSRIQKIRVHISSVRKKIGDDYRNPYFILTVEGRGYRFTEH